MLTVLMDGRALTAAELADVAGIAPQTASTHLARLIGAELVAVKKQGRHRYHRLAGPAVASLLESLMRHTMGGGARHRVPRTGPRDEVMRLARTCYDHLAGRLGVAIADALVAQGHVEMDDEAGLITAGGAAFFTRIGISLPNSSRRLTRPLCRPCLDWSERRPHLGGRLGAAICTHGLTPAGSGASPAHAQFQSHRRDRRHWPGSSASPGSSGSREFRETLPRPDRPVFAASAAIVALRPAEITQRLESQDAQRAARGSSTFCVNAWQISS
jgi:hypothetical protein